MNVRARHLIVGALFIAAVIGALVLARWSGGDRSAGRAGDSRAEAGPAAVRDRDRLAGAGLGQGAPPGGDAAARVAEPGVVAEARARLERDIALARDRRMARAREQLESEAAGSGSAEAPPKLDVGSMEKEYIQERIREIVPLIKECYDLSRDRRPALQGTLTVRFTLAGEPEIGGIVESSEIDAERSTISDPGMSECISESIYALEFEPPSNGGRVEVRYPFTFRTSDEE